MRARAEVDFAPAAALKFERAIAAFSLLPNAQRRGTNVLIDTNDGFAACGFRGAALESLSVKLSYGVFWIAWLRLNQNAPTAGA
jgi:hypothetical protein